MPQTTIPAGPRRLPRTVPRVPPARALHPYQQRPREIAQAGDEDLTGPSTRSTGCCNSTSLKKSVYPYFIRRNVGAVAIDATSYEWLLRHGDYLNPDKAAN